MTSSSGTFTDCGLGQPFFLEFNCTGANCDLLDDFPGVNCTTEGTTLSCTNGISCPGSNYTTTFNISQPLNAVITSMQIYLSDACIEYDVLNNGTQSGVSIESVPIANCTPVASSTSSSSPSPSTSSVSSSIAPHSSLSTSSFSSGVSFRNTSLIASTLPTISTTTTCSTTDLLSSLATGSSSYSVTSSSMAQASHEISTANSPCPSTTSSSSLETVLKSPSGIPSQSTNGPSSTTPNTPVSNTLPSPVQWPSGSGTISTGSPLAITSALPSAIGSEPATTSENETEPAAEVGSTALVSETPETTLVNVGTSTLTSTSTPVIASIPTPQPPTSGARTARRPGTLGICYLLLVLFAFFHTTVALDFASENITSLNPIKMRMSSSGNSLGLGSGELVPRAEDADPFGEAVVEILEEWVAGKITDPQLADSIFAEIWDAICEHFASGVLTSTVFAEVGSLIEYVQVVFDTIALPEGPAGWVIAFAFNVALNIVVAKLFPQIEEMAKAACEQPEPCTKNFESDPDNCGQCGIVCASGVCENSSCVSNFCTGETCETFTACGPGGTCVCASTAEGTGFCVDGSTPCSGLQNCNISSDCPAGQICAVATCCEVSVCVGATFCGGANATSSAKFLFRREIEGPWIGHLY